MKHQKTKKLTLERTTLRNLTPIQLETIAGGILSALCASVACYRRDEGPEE